MLLSSSPPPLCFGSLVNLVPNIEWKRGTRLFFNSNWTGIPWNRLKKTIHLLEAGLLALLVLLIQKIYLLAPMPALLKKKQTSKEEEEKKTWIFSYSSQILFVNVFRDIMMSFWIIDKLFFGLISTIFCCAYSSVQTLGVLYSLLWFPH